ncbi:MAG: hypothetical protein AB8B81_10600 [Halioglobus sp.]
MSNFAKSLGLIAALGMGLFSGNIYMQTGDWVAAVFCVGSAAYFLFFISKHTN